MASTALASSALARDGQWYVELGGGPMIVEDLELGVDDDVDQIGLDSDEGFDFGGAVGHDFGAFRLEAEASYREWEFDTIQVGPTGLRAPNGFAGSGDFDVSGDPNALSFMVNGLLDFGPDDGLQGFVGGGVGVARTDFDVLLGVNDGRSVDDSDTGFAYQILAGVRAPLSRSVDVGLKYRMFTQPDLELLDATGRTLDDKLRTHSILGTLTFNFGADEPPPPIVVAPPPPPPRPPVVQAPPPPPAPTCNRGPYIVFFDWDQSDITPEAAQVLDNARSAYQNCGSASVMLAGHTDLSGTDAYNIGLSERRNESVREYLSARGIPDARISSQAFGESRPRVPTAEGVRELQNRRVEITYGPGSGM